MSVKVSKLVRFIPRLITNWLHDPEHFLGSLHYCYVCKFRHWTILWFRFTNVQPIFL